MTIEPKKLASLLKKAASRIEELEKAAESHQKESGADEVIKNMITKGLITEKQAASKKKEMLQNNSIDFHKKAMEFYNGTPVAIGIPSSEKKSGDPLDSWVYGT